MPTTRSASWCAGCWPHCASAPAHRDRRALSGRRARMRACSTSTSPRPGSPSTGRASGRCASARWAGSCWSCWSCGSGDSPRRPLPDPRARPDVRPARRPGAPDPMGQRRPRGRRRRRARTGRAPAGARRPPAGPQADLADAQARGDDEPGLAAGAPGPGAGHLRARWPGSSPSSARRLDRGRAPTVLGRDGRRGPPPAHRPGRPLDRTSPAGGGAVRREQRS